MSKSWRSLYLFCIGLLCIKQIQSEIASMSKEGLQEEHLLPVGMTRVVVESDFEGSGDVDDVPIRELNNNVMERMTMKTDEEEDNKVVESLEEENSSKETVETIDEGSGFNEESPKTDSAVEKVANSTTTEVIVEETTENNVEHKQEETETTTMKEEEPTTVREDEEEETTVVKKIETTTENTETTMTIESMTEEGGQTTTEANAKEEITTPLPDFIPGVVHEEETTARTETISTTGTTTVLEETTAPTVKSAEPEPVTEVIQIKHVRPVLAASPNETVTTKAPKDVNADVNNGTVHANLTAGTDTLLMKINSRLLDANEAILDHSKDPSRLGTYIIVSLILLSFLSLVGFILMKRRIQKRRKKSNLDQEALETEKALLSLSEYKDHPDGMDENKIKNNEITPIVIKSNSQINKFEKNTNFSSPKNLNTKANEKNVEKDNVLKENLTQVIIEDPTKDVEEEKAEKLIVRTHLDQDSVPKKPVIVNRTSLGSVPLSQE